MHLSEFQSALRIQNRIKRLSMRSVISMIGRVVSLVVRSRLSNGLNGLVVPILAQHHGSKWTKRPSGFAYQTSSPVRSETIFTFI